MTAETEKETRLLSERLSLPREFPFPYTPEDFSDEERVVLSRFFTNVDKPVFAIKNLPQEVVGAMFSRYSRAEESVRRVFLNEFWGSPELGIQNIAGYLVEEGVGLEAAREKAAGFYRRVFAEYGDDSVIQMGSVHIAFEFVSQIAAKAIEDGRIGAAYIEKSTRYVDFGGRVNGHYLFIEEPTITESVFGGEFLAWNQAIFDAYCTHLPTTIEHLRGKYPIEAQEFHNPKTGEAVAFSQITTEKERAKAIKAYERALRAKAFDTIRVFLPTTTVTNLGAHFSGQAAEHALNKLISSSYPEVRLLGAMAYEELAKIAPNFLQNVDHRYGVITRNYLKEVREAHEQVSDKWVSQIEEIGKGNRARLVDWDEEADVRIATQILYTGQTITHRSKRAIFEWARKVKKEDLSKNPNVWWSPRLAEIIVAAVPARNTDGLNRRHKLPRAFEHAFAEAEFDVDFGIYRDLQRNRMSTTERQRLSAETVDTPKEFSEPGMELVLRDYLRIADWTKNLHRRLVKSGDLRLKREAEYVTILGNRLRFNVRANIRQWAFFSELRTIEGGHPTYRKAMQRATRQLLYVMPFLKPLFTHVGWTKDYGLGRLRGEIKTQEKLF